MSKHLTIAVWASLLFFSTASGCNKKEATTAPSPISIEALAQQTQQRLLAQPEVKKALEGQSQGTTDEALERLARRGWKRLKDEQLFQRVRIRRKLLSSADITTCAAVVRDKATETQTHTALAKLDATDVTTFFTLKETAP